MADILLGNVKGPQGNTGATGSQGPQGDAATITVGTVSTTAYGNTASVTNSGTAQDAVLDFVIPQGKPGEQTTRMGALTLDTITAQSADFPIPAVGETGSTVFGKIIKFFNSTISALNSKLNISDVVNNLTSTSTTQPLSAAQGKALNDAKANASDLATTNATVTSIQTVTEATIAQEYTQQRTAHVIRCQKSSGVPLVHIQIAEEYTIDIPGGTTILRLPSGYRPSETISVPSVMLLGTGGTTRVLPVVIYADGSIKQNVTSTMRALYVDTWIKI